MTNTERQGLMTNCRGSGAEFEAIAKFRQYVGCGVCERHFTVRVQGGRIPAIVKVPRHPATEGEMDR